MNNDSRDTDPWIAFDAATQLYRDGFLCADEYDGAVLAAFGERDGGLVLGAVLHVLGE